ncbi:MAG TPA: XRE family transcriptional regulator [Propionibacteriaceae bacterium]
MARLFDPARLTQARILKGMTKRELAEAVGVSPAAIGQYEAELTTPRPDLLAELSRTLGQDVRFFAGGRPFLRLDTTDAHFRSLRSIRAADRDLALTTAEQIWELTCALERHIQLPAVHLPETAADATPHQAAQALRQHWKLDRGPVKHLVANMESHGIVVLLAEAAGHIDRVDAFSTVVAERPIVMSTPRRSRDVYRHRFTCAHELGHLLLHQGCPSGDITLERQADEFAAELLTPAAEMQSLLPQRMDLAALDRLGRTWGVSVESLVRRMSELRIVSDATVRRAYMRLNALRPLGVEEPVHAYTGEVPRMLRDAVHLAESVGSGVRQLAAELHWRPARIRELLGLEDPRPTLRLVT